MEATIFVSKLLQAVVTKVHDVKLVLIGFVMLISFTAFAQGPLDAYVITTPGSNGNVYGFVHVDLPDTVTILSVEVKLGSNDAGTDLLNHVFAFDVTQGLLSGYSWQRSGKHVVLQVGQFTETAVVFGQIRLQSNASVWSDAYSFVTN